MWEDLGYKLPIQEGIYWLDHGLIKGFTSNGELHNLYKIKIFDDLSISIKKHKDYNKSISLQFESWKDTYIRLSKHLDEIEKESLSVIKQAMIDYSDYDWWCLTSTGKDSTVTLHIIQKLIPNIKVMFNNTSCDCADTYKMVKSHSDWIITNPKEGIYPYFRRLNYIPNRVSRGCCTIYKEGASINYFTEHKVEKLIQVMGVRNSESKTRSDREYITHNPKWKDNNWYGLLPIRKWSDLDVWLYILRENLEINPKYKKGYSRVGCAICCPYYTKSTWILDKYWYPKAYEHWHMRLEEVFLQSQRWQQLNCTIKEYHSCWNGTLLRPEPTNEVVQEMMKYKGLTDENIARQYFNKTCVNDSKNIRQKDVLAMNMKMFGRQTNKFLCKKCLMKEFGWNKEDWNNMVDDFKRSGCKLF